MKVFAIVLSLVVFCAAQEPQPCHSPEQWEARIYRSDRSKEFSEFGKITYDETNQRARIIEERMLGSDKDYYDTLYLHTINKMYRLNLKTRQCNVTALTERFRPFGVPHFAKFVYESEVGAAGVPGESLTAQIWEGTYDDGAKFETTVTFPDCVPIHHSFYSNDTGVVFTEYVNDIYVMYKQKKYHGLGGEVYCDRSR